MFKKLRRKFKKVAKGIAKVAKPLVRVAKPFAKIALSSLPAGAAAQAALKKAAQARRLVKGRARAFKTSFNNVANAAKSQALSSIYSAQREAGRFIAPAGRSASGIRAATRAVPTAPGAMPPTLRAPVPSLVAASARSVAARRSVQPVIPEHAPAIGSIFEPRRW